MDTMNIALLTKLAWRIYSNPHSFLAKLISAKYGARLSFRNPQSPAVSINNNPLYTALQTGYDSLRSRILWQIGNGSTVKMAQDPWVPSIPQFIPALKPTYQYVFSACPISNK